jgi:hypothetical protein
MNIHVNEFHNVGICESPPPFSDKFREKWVWTCLDIINEIREPSP